MQTVSISERDSEGSLAFFSAVSFHTEQAEAGLRASAEDVAIHQSRRLSRKQKESLLLFFQSEEPGSFQEILRA